MGGWAYYGVVYLWGSLVGVLYIWGAGMGLLRRVLVRLIGRCAADRLRWP